MIDKNLVASINDYIQQGYSKEQIISYLVSYGYPSQDVNDSFDYFESTAAQPKQPAAQPSPAAEAQPQPTQPEQPAVPKAGKKKLLIIASIAVAVLLIVSVTAYWFMTRPVCGNGIVEKGETMETCCEDTGCLGEQTCENHMCIEPVCGECQYLEEHVCKDYECCDNEDCADDEECVGHECITLECGFCQYGSNHQCLDYECCSDEDCETGEECADHECVVKCGECQYRVDSQCLDYECCENEDCGYDEECTDNFCVPLVCGAGEIASNHECIIAQACTTDEDCDDNISETLDLCVEAGTPTAHCVHMAADQCQTDSDCDDDDITTDDVCAGTPRKCSHTNVNCDEIGEECLPSYGTCNGTIESVLDTEYCCIGICIEGADLYIQSMDEADSVLEVKIWGIATVSENETFKIHAFENNTMMNTTDGLEYATLNSKNETDTVYFNFTLFNVTINVTAVVDYDNQINETNETNNNMTIQVSLD